VRAIWLALVSLGCAHAVAGPGAPEPDPATRTELGIGKLARLLDAETREEYADTELTAYVTSVGRRLTEHCARPTLPWSFRVLDAPEADARAYPGGRVVITRGALAVLGSEAELAGVLAHEVAHVASRHADTAWRADFPPVGGDDATRRAALRDADHERQADALAVRYLAAAGYDARGLAVALLALERVAPHSGELEDPHPLPDARASRLAVLASTAPGEWGRARYFARMNGLSLGPNPAVPRLIGRRFVVPGALALEVPPELVLVSNERFLSAKAGDESELLVLVFSHGLGASFRDEFRSLPHTVTELLGRPVYSIRSATSEASVALVDRGSTLLLLVAKAPLLARVLDTATLAPRATRGPWLSVRRVTRPMRFEALLDTECPDTSDFEAMRLNGIGPEARLKVGSFVKCVRPNSIAVERRRK
jgi:hypothetical protein